MESDVKTLDNYLSPTAQTILKRWRKQPNIELKTMTATELINCTENDLRLIKFIMELTTKPFIPRCSGAGISFCSSQDRRVINEILEYCYGK